MPTQAKRSAPPSPARKASTTDQPTRAIEDNSEERANGSVSEIIPEQAAVKVVKVKKKKASGSSSMPAVEGEEAEIVKVKKKKKKKPAEAA